MFLENSEEKKTIFVQMRIKQTFAWVHCVSFMSLLHSYGGSCFPSDGSIIFHFNWLQSFGFLNSLRWNGIELVELGYYSEIPLP